MGIHRKSQHVLPKWSCHIWELVRQPHCTLPRGWGEGEVYARWARGFVCLLALCLDVPAASQPPTRGI